ncbi:dihydrofolate synthase / folylpolyglutamate synthase [Desulfotomaculum arcticum]|uniref:Dihydrofolate synthase/folylpolyglutamate synthase n=1 Tax=Desulfotruncus arcticus DSM 17038 TaxID=1121424 RepID=A0A1I2UGS9_9FIRM|nr:folylpolyglutamate synthase/dihydrofolate synthase family protein [Desulfotruncus arcticus]SFG76352.1 dihydrofolate synthase / folylpolyglutamate synthase [Desulfotomaculum arcticum] [Desulfotruncus arcticus DSM 17038]
MLYQEAMDYLQNLTKFGMNFGLGRITELLRRLNNPHRRIRVIHVGGTNGKGSTTAMIARVLQSAGYRVGTFTSPHLHSFTERYLINNQEIKPERVAQLISVLRPHLESMVAEGFEHPTEFEVSTAMAFCYFEEEKVDFLVLEVGLGGAIDSTNVVTPILSVITNVAMDHMDYLGYTIAEIASVKAGIIKPGAPVVTASDKPEALEIIESVCKEQGCRLVRVGRDVSWARGGHSLQGQFFDYNGAAWKMKDLWISFLGSHQVINAATAVASLEVLQQQGVNIEEDALREGLAATIWPARLELIGTNPPVLVDAAHNYDGARCLRQALDEYFPEKRIIMVLGMLGDKERSKVVAELAPRAGHVIITKPNSPRAGDWMQMADEARRYLSRVDTIENIAQAVALAINLAGEGDLICVTGSFYMVAEAREAVLKFYY